MTALTPSPMSVSQDMQTYRRIDGGKDDPGGSEGAFVIVLANHKGGVTKTTSTANLGACLAETGRRVLLVDADPQANLSEAFGWGEEVPGERLEDLLVQPDAAGRLLAPPALRPDVGADVWWREHLRIIPCTDQLADVAADLPASVGEGWEQRLQAVLDPLRDRFDVVLIDTPPGLGTLSGMAMLAADGLLIPARPADLDVRGHGGGAWLRTARLAPTAKAQCCRRSASWQLASPETWRPHCGHAWALGPCPMGQ